MAGTVPQKVSRFQTSSTVFAVLFPLLFFNKFFFLFVFLWHSSPTPVLLIDAADVLGE